MHKIIDMGNQYGVYIIESLRSGDYFDGYTLKEILELSGIRVEYKWVETKEEFINALQNFEKTKLRYLHISCHADYEGLELTNDEITNAEFENLVKGKINNKRIFLSACKGGNKHLASIAIKNGAYSLIGSPIDLHFDKAALFWASFFHVISEYDNQKMKKLEITYVLESCVDLFNIPINYYAFIRNNRKNQMKRAKVRPNKKTNIRKVAIF